MTVLVQPISAIPPDQLASGDWYAHIKAIDNAGNASSTANVNFNVPSPSTYTVTYDGSGTSYRANDTLAIMGNITQWKAVDSAQIPVFTGSNVRGMEAVAAMLAYHPSIDVTSIILANQTCNVWELHWKIEQINLQQ